MSKKINFYLTSNFGGGGQTVSRIFSYFSLFDHLHNSNIHLLLNYRYLDYPDIKPNFNSDEVSKIRNDNLSLNEFIHVTGNRLSKKTSSSYAYKKSLFNPDILLDSGMGSILQHWIIDLQDNSPEKLREKSINLLQQHLDFIKKTQPKYFIGLDYCKKNTYKKGQEEKQRYHDLLDILINDNKAQKELLRLTIKRISSDKGGFRGSQLLAPLHGNDHKAFIKNYKNLLLLEKDEGFSFSGFALGGLAEYTKKASKIGRIVKEMRELGENRIIHILGSSGLDKLPILIMAGANSFDCHSPWRRANDGDPDKIMIPMLKNNLDFSLLDEKLLSYKNIKEVNEKNFYCDCPVCIEYPINRIKNLHDQRTKNNEDYLFSKILIYTHAIYQYHYLQKKLSALNGEKDFYNFFKEIKDKKLSEKLIKEADQLLN
jgi:hypothetical protein